MKKQQQIWRGKRWVAQCQHHAGQCMNTPEPGRKLCARHERVAHKVDHFHKQGGR